MINGRQNRVAHSNSRCAIVYGCVFESISLLHHRVHTHTHTPAYRWPRYRARQYLSKLIENDFSFIIREQSNYRGCCCCCCCARKNNHQSPLPLARVRPGKNGMKLHNCFALFKDLNEYVISKWRAQSRDPGNSNVSEEGHW